MICPASRASALGQLDGFLLLAGSYARDRNHVIPGHPSVSRLSPAIRHRLITEQEVAAASLRVHPFGRVEKFIQEVYWRRYWKSWLALRPGVWARYLDDLGKIAGNPEVRRVEEARSGNEVIDYFTNELVSTGYLHNHARMWFAAWWVHEARLPWQLGAEFFFRHLLDGDPASNILSWRWVAGLQTPGKTYLARRGNLEKYLAPELLDCFSGSMSAFENPQALQQETIAKTPVTHKEPLPESRTPFLTTGLWIHEEDLSVETSPMAGQSFSTVVVTADAEAWERHRFPAGKRGWISEALQDAATRAEGFWNCPTTLEMDHSHTGALLRWAKSMNLQQVAAIRPEVGPLHDSLPTLQAALASSGVRLILIDRPEDIRVRPFAAAGFFPFWERLRKSLVTKPPANDSHQQQTLLDLQ